MTLPAAHCVYYSSFLELPLWSGLAFDFDSEDTDSFTLPDKHERDVRNVESRTKGGKPGYPAECRKKSDLAVTDVTDVAVRTYLNELTMDSRLYCPYCATDIHHVTCWYRRRHEQSQSTSRLENIQREQYLASSGAACTATPILHESTCHSKSPTTPISNGVEVIGADQVGM